MCEKREKRLDRSLPRSPRTRSASPPDARASPHAATWPVPGINSQLLREGLLQNTRSYLRNGVLRERFSPPAGTTGSPSATPDYSAPLRSEEHTSELQSLRPLVCRL